MSTVDNHCDASECLDSIALNAREKSPARTDVHAREITQQLGRNLTPVVVDLGPGQPRFGSYLQWDERRGAPLLVPVAGEALSLALLGEPAPIRIRSSDPAQPWMLTARALHVASDRMAVVELARSEPVRMPDRVPGRTQARGREPLVLVVHPGAGAIEGHVFPLTSLGAGHCLIDATLPLERGQILGPVEVIGERRILRRATARVVEVIPWVTAHADRRFRCRLVFEEPARATVLDEGHDLLSDSDRISHLFELASMVELPGWYDGPGWPRARMRIDEIRDGLVTIAAGELPPPAAIPLPAEVRIGFELFSVSYEGWVRLHRRRGSKVEVALPFVMRRRRRRREQRATVDPRLAVMMRFRNSATGEQQSRRIRDVSFGGACIEAEPSDLLWQGACLEDARIVWAEGDVPVGDLEVRGVDRTADGSVLCHTANRGLMPSDNPALIHLLASSHHPEAERHDGSDFLAMVGFYERAGLLGEFMLRNLRPVLPEATVVWRKLHDRESSVACTLVYRGGPAREPQAALSGVRVWENTWLSQHFGALGTADRRATGTLQLAYFDFVMPQKDTHYMAFFVKAENARMNAFHEKFFELTGTPESVSRVTISLWTLKSGTSVAISSQRSADFVRPMVESDEVIVSRAAERVFGSMATAALSFIPKEFALPATAGRFARLNLEREREASVITDGRSIKAALFKERTSPGVNLTWMLDAWWLLPVESYWTMDEGPLAVAAQAIAQQTPERPEADKFLIVPHGSPTGPLVEAGFERLLNAHLYVLNRSGLRRYYEYIADRYGELGVKVANRSARLVRSVS